MEGIGTIPRHPILGKKNEHSLIGMHLLDCTWRPTLLSKTLYLN